MSHSFPSWWYGFPLALIIIIYSTGTDNLARLFPYLITLLTSVWCQLKSCQKKTRVRLAAPPMCQKVHYIIILCALSVLSLSLLSPIDKGGPPSLLLSLARNWPSTVAAAASHSPHPGAQEDGFLSNLILSSSSVATKATTERIIIVIIFLCCCCCLFNRKHTHALHTYKL